MISKIPKSVAIIVAHPDDETLWAGGMALSHPSWRWFTVCLCRASDKDRSPKFFKALKVLKSEGIMGDLEDGPEQTPLEEKVVERTIIQLLPNTHFDLIITHNPSGNQARDVRDEEVSKAVINLWSAGKISTNELWTFAYEDGNREYFPRPIEKATIYRTLTNRIWLRKYSLLTETYGIKKDSLDVETTPKAEAFWKFTDPYDAQRWLKMSGS